MDHDPEKWRPVFPRDKREALRGDHAQAKRELNLFATTGIDLPLGMIT